MSSLKSVFLGRMAITMLLYNTVESAKLAAGIL